MSALAFDIKDQLNLSSQGSKTIAGTPYDSNRFFTIFFIVFQNLYIITGIILFIMIILGGLGMITNAGNVEKQKQGSKTLTSAVIGYVIMFVAYWIIKIIEIIFGVELI